MQIAAKLSGYELERGKPMPSINHGIVQACLISELVSRYKDKYTVVSELSLDLPTRPVTPDTVTPDISVYPKRTVDWLHDTLKMTDPPLLIIEILSPKQSLDDLVQKVEGYFKDSVKSCWIVQPVIGLITIFTPDMKYKTFSSGPMEDPAMEIKVDLNDIF